MFTLYEQLQDSSAELVGQGVHEETNCMRADSSNGSEQTAGHSCVCSDF